MFIDFNSCKQLRFVMCYCVLCGHTVWSCFSQLVINILFVFRTWVSELATSTSSDISTTETLTTTTSSDISTAATVTIHATTERMLPEPHSPSVAPGIDPTTEVYVNWTYPDSDVNFTVTAFANSPEETHVNFTTDHFITFSGLMPGQRYVFTVTPCKGNCGPKSNTSKPIRTSKPNCLIDMWFSVVPLYYIYMLCCV